MTSNTLMLSPHFMHNGTGYGDWLKARPRVVKLCGAFPSDIVPPGTLVIGRATTSNDGVSPDMGAPEKVAQSYFFGFVLPTARKNSWIKHWEAQNEPAWNEGKTAEQYRADMRWYARYHAEFARLCWEHGLFAVLGSWSVGTPYLPAAPNSKEFLPDDAARIWDDYGKALEAMRSYRAIFSRHSYGAFNEWLALRHRADYRAFKRLGFGDTKVVITECGEEYIFGEKPWKLNPKYSGSLRAYFDRYLVPLEFELRKDSAYLLGATVFTLGTGSASEWDKFDIASPEIGKWMQELAAVPSPTPPPSVPPPPSADVFTNQKMYNTVRHIARIAVGMVIPYDVMRLMLEQGARAKYTGQSPRQWVIRQDWALEIERLMLGQGWKP